MNGFSLRKKCFHILKCKHLVKCVRTYGKLTKEVKEALTNKTPVVALESTIITHGMTYPANLNMARAVETLCYNNKVTPATIALLDGEICVGVTSPQLEQLAKSTSNLYKISRRDIAMMMSHKLSGGTTVSGTMIIAKKNGIDIFATGGIGGVHRDGESSLDISADLTELGRTSVTVVCGGVKSILDIGRTLEVLETQGVTVVTFGDSRAFPAFFTRKSGYDSSYNVKTFQEAAELIHENKKLELGSGIVIAVPIPTEFEKDGKVIESAIKESLKECGEQDIRGSEVTPFVLENVSRLTKGVSLQANIGLVKNNVRVACGISDHLTKLQGQTRRYSTDSKEDHLTKLQGQTRRYSTDRKEDSGRTVIVGAVNIDVLAEVDQTVLKSGKDLIKGSVFHTMGGVGRNVAECLYRLGHQSTLVSAVGDDMLGQVFVSSHQEIGVERVVIVKDSNTPVANLFIEDGDMTYGIADFELHRHITPDLITRDLLRDAAIVILDCDPPLQTGLKVAVLCEELRVPLCLEPTAPAKVSNMVEAGALKYVTMISPNLLELKHITRDLPKSSAFSSLFLSSIPPTFHSTIKLCLNQAQQCIRGMSRQFTRTILVSLGPLGVLHYSVDWDDKTHVLHILPAPSDLLPVTVISASGAGDSLVGGYLAKLLEKGFRKDVTTEDIESALKLGCFCAFHSLSTKHCINQTLDKTFIAERLSEWENDPSWTVNVIYSDF